MLKLWINKVNAFAYTIGGITDAIYVIYLYFLLHPTKMKNLRKILLVRVFSL